MNHPNSSLSSFDNYYDISIKGMPKKKFVPRRVGSLSSLTALNEPKRPSDYYIQKLSNSSLNLNAAKPQNRPISGDSIISLQSNLSDDLLVGSSHFDPESRLSSLTSNSISPSDSPSINNFHFVGSEKNISTNSTFNDSLPSGDEINSSLSTITLKKSTPTRPANNKASSTTNLPSKRQVPQRTSSQRSLSNSSSPSLTRTKTKFLNARETKERMQLRKKQYDEDDDDEILSNDLDLVFNVPVLKNDARLYLNNNSSSKLWSQSDLHDTKYKVSLSPKAYPAGSKLSHSTSSLEHASPGGISQLTEDSILEEEEDSVGALSFSNDSEISQNISNFYSQKSESFSKLVKMSREQNMMYKLPNFVKSQSSMEDLNLISMEKLGMLDQTRPINLPPKDQVDKMKHNKEFLKVLINFESNSKAHTELKKKSRESLAANQQAWLKLLTSDDKDFSKRFYQDKNNVRKLNWDSLVPDHLRYDYFYRVLTEGLTEESLKGIKNSFNGSKANYDKLSDQMKISKDNEFNRIIERVISRPFYASLIDEFKENMNLKQFKENFKFLLYIKSLSEQGLKKHDEIFMIPVFLLIFQDEKDVDKIFELIELFNSQIFNTEMIDQLNKRLSGWSKASYTTCLYKVLTKFSDLNEFENLNTNSLFEIIIQLNDKLPLSLSAPSTPIVAQTGKFETEEEGEGVFNNCANMSLIMSLLQLLVTYSHSSKTKLKNNARLMETFLFMIFRYYHINWNDYNDLIRNNKSVKLNNCMDAAVNWESFVDKWRHLTNRV